MQSLATQTANRSTTEPALPTFMDHLQELKSRFFWIAIYFMVASSLAYPYFQNIIDILVKPLGDQKLYYTTVAGGLSFILKVCMYVGVVAILPVLIYHLYRFIAPVMHKNNARSLMIYTISSSFLALAGIAFAYFVTLPAALHFLTSINLNHIDSLLTLDSYVSFVVAYVIAGAVLFQLPLVLLIINSITPLPPKKLMSYQRHMIVGAFVMAAILSPTPDVVNQSIMAAPVIVMYQFGIILVWIRQRSQRRALKHTSQRKTAASKTSVKAATPTTSTARPMRLAPALASVAPISTIPTVPELSSRDIRPKRAPLVAAATRRPVASRTITVPTVIAKHSSVAAPTAVQSPTVHKKASIAPSVIQRPKLSPRPSFVAPSSLSRPSLSRPIYRGTTTTQSLRRPVTRGIDGFTAPRLAM